MSTVLLGILASPHLEVPRPAHGTKPATAIAHRLHQLAIQLPDDQIAEYLNAEGYPTAPGLL